MSDENLVYANQNVLFTLKGMIGVQYLDGETISGEFITQDAYNIFIRVDGEAMMIPRQQIRFIKSLTGGSVEADTSQEMVIPQPTVVDTQPLPKPESSTLPTPFSPTEIMEAGEGEPEEAPAEAEDVWSDIEPKPQAADEFVDEKATAEAEDIWSDVEPKPQAADEFVDEADEFVDEDEGTMILPVATADIPSFFDTPETGEEDADEAEEDEDDGTLILVPTSEPEPEPATKEITNESLQYVDEAEMSPDIAEDELDMTVVLGDEDDLDLDILGLAEPELAAPLATATLTITEGPHSGQSYDLGEGTITIGRSSDNVVVLSSDKEASRHHAIILLEAGRFVLQDQNSLNGTFVNEVQVSTPHTLTSGDKILVGVSWFSFEQ
jgi:hypothetical protein